ncbi:MAG: chemotaxis-specific protein-glutamate methyltransferase CheB [Planctomycetales bacterium]
MESIRVLVVDDSALFRTLMRNALTEIPGCEVVGSVADGETALARIDELKPDLVTLDVEMPGMSGIAVLKELRRRRLKTRVVMVSRLTAAGAQVTTDALMQGAFDFILKPHGKDPAANKEALSLALREKIQSLQEALNPVPHSPPEPTDREERKTPTKPATTCKAVIIGSSTGGPDALAQLLPYLSVELPVPVVVVQHMPERFTGSLANRLNEASDLEIVEAADKMPLNPGKIVIAHGGKHLRLVRRPSGAVVAQLTEDPHEHSCRPAVDYTLRSAVDAFDGPILVVILTGMGRDGTEGCRLVRQRGGQVIAQHSDGCTVYGMPKSVIAAGQADQILRLADIGPAIEAAV